MNNTLQHMTLKSVLLRMQYYLKLGLVKENRSGRDIINSMWTALHTDMS